MEDDFKVIIDSLGNMALSWIPEVNQVTIYPNSAEGTAHLEILLQKDDWKVREVAAEKIVELRSMFLDDLALDYCFVEGSDEMCGPAQTQSPRLFVNA